MPPTRAQRAKTAAAAAAAEPAPAAPAAAPVAISTPPPKRRARKQPADSVAAYEAAQKRDHTLYETRVRTNPEAMQKRREYSKSYWDTHKAELNAKRREKRQQARAAALAERAEQRTAVAQRAGAEASQAAVSVQQARPGQYAALPATLTVPADLRTAMGIDEINTNAAEPMNWPSFRRSSWEALAQSTRNGYVQTGKNLYSKAGYTPPKENTDPLAIARGMLAGSSDIWQVLRALYNMKATKGPYAGQPLLAASRNSYSSALEALMIEAVRAYVRDGASGSDAGFKKAVTWVAALHHANTSSHHQANEIRKKQIRGTAQAAKFLSLDQMQAAADAYIKRLKPTSSQEKLRDGALFAYSAYMGNCVRNAFCMAEIGDKKPGGADYAIRWSPQHQCIWSWMKSGEGMKNARKFKSTNTIPVPVKAQRMFMLYASALPQARHPWLFPNKRGDGHISNAEFGKLMGDLYEKHTGVRTDNSVIGSAYITDILERNPELAAHDSEWLQREALKMSQTDPQVFLSYRRFNSDAEKSARTAGSGGGGDPKKAQPVLSNSRRGGKAAGRKQ